MTEKVNPSPNRAADAFKTAASIGYGGHSDGYITKTATEASVQDGNITEGNLNSFAQSSSASSFDVTIDPGEAFVFGSWLAIDTSTTVTLASSTNNQTVYVGWNKGSTDDVIVGLSSAFSSTSGDTDQKIPLYDFDTDGSGVTSVTDRRRLGKTVDASVEYTNSTQSANYTTNGEGFLFVDTSSSTVTITLSDADTRSGNEIIIADTGNALTNKITVDTESSQTIDGSSSVTIQSDYGTKRLTSDGTNWFSSGGGGGSGEPVAYEPGMTSFGDGLSDEEVYRMVLQSGEEFTLSRLELRLKGGGSNSNVSLDVYDSTAATQIDTVNAGSTSTAGGTSGTGNTILFRISNSSGSAQDANPIVRGTIE